MSESRLKVLVVHNDYQFRGGEDAVVDSEIALLREYGHEVELYIRHNDEIAQMSRLGLLAQTVWSSRTSKDFCEFVKRFQPDVVHVHNTTPLISPSIYWAAAAARVPIVQTLHNFRLICAQAMFLRDGHVCEDCLGKGLWRGVMRGCYRGSRLQSAALAGTITLHRAIGTYEHKVTQYIALNEFCRSKLISGGLPAERISIKPNFVNWRPTPQWDTRQGGLFVGRLSEEKGVTCLLAALSMLPGSPVQVIGDGPLSPLVRESLGDAYVGFQSLESIWHYLSSAAYLVLPSLWFEAFPRTIVEAFASGVPVIASRIGSLQELVEDGKTGLLFEPGDEKSLAEKLIWASSHPAEMLSMGRAARAVYEEKFAPQRNIQTLLSIYRSAMADTLHTA